MYTLYYNEQSQDWLLLDTYIHGYKARFTTGNSKTRLPGQSADIKVHVEQETLKKIERELIENHNYTETDDWYSV